MEESHGWRVLTVLPNESELCRSNIHAGTNIKLHPDEMDKLNETSLRMRDGSGSLAVLGVYHELHCVVKSRSAAVFGGMPRITDNFIHVLETTAEVVLPGVLLSKPDRPRIQRAHDARR